MSAHKNFRKMAVMVAFLLGVLFPVLADGPGEQPPSSSPAGPVGDGLQSGDYQTYLGSLQAAGLSDQTIRTVITADVGAAFAGKRSAALGERYQNFQYWKIDSSETAARARLAAQRRAIDEEMNGVLQQLLGPADDLPDVSREWEKKSMEFELAFLSPEKREATKTTLLAYAKVEQQMKELCGGLFVTEDTNELQQILASHKEMQSTLQQILLPEEYKRVEMTSSWTAENLRHALVQFAPTESEFRIIFDAWRPHDENLTQIYATRQADPGNQQVYAKLKEQLSSDRYNEYTSTWWK